MSQIRCPIGLYSNDVFERFCSRLEISTRNPPNQSTGSTLGVPFQCQRSQRIRGSRSIGVHQVRCGRLELGVSPTDGLCRTFWILSLGCGGSTTRFGYCQSGRYGLARKTHAHFCQDSIVAKITRYDRIMSAIERCRSQFDCHSWPVPGQLGTDGGGGPGWTGLVGSNCLDSRICPKYSHHCQRKCDNFRGCSEQSTIDKGRWNYECRRYFGSSGALSAAIGE